MRRKSLPQELVRELFTYEDGKLFWRKTVGHMPAGKEAGHKWFSVKDKNFRWVITYKGKVYPRSILIWIYHYGEVPLTHMVDHRKSGNTLNDCLENLRLATYKENAENRVKHSTFKGKPTSSKYKGVSWCKSRNKWQAQIKSVRKGKVIKLFLGRFDTEEEAYAAYVAAAKLRHGDFFHTGFRADNA